MGATRRFLVATVAVLLVAAFVVVGVRLLLGSTGRRTVVEQCTAASFTLSPSQAAVASTMTGVVISRELPERAAVLVLAAGLQESKLTNLASGEGDRDSVGVLQQRPSQGWGTPEQLGNVQFATGAFLDALVKVENWQTGDLAHIIQQVQISADEAAYSKHEAAAQAFADAFLGKTPAGLSCTYPTPTAVAAPAAIGTQLAADLPVNGTVPGATTVTVPGAGWQTVAWLVANGDRLGLESVTYAGRRWHRVDGWHDDAGAARTAVTATVWTKTTK